MKTLFFTTAFFLSAISLAQELSVASLPAEGQAQARHENAFVQAGTKLLLIGGRGEKTIDIYNTETREWTEGARPPMEVHHMQAVSLDGLVYVAGALTGGWPSETPISHILVYDPVEDTWTIGAEIPEDRRRGAAGVAVYRDKIYIVNGIINGHASGWVNWMDEFDPATNTWKKLPDSPRTRDHFHAVVIDDRLYAAGGRRSGSVEGRGFAGTVKETDVYDFNTGRWESLPDIPTPRAGSATAVIDGNPVVLGGESDVQETAHSEVEMLDLDEGKWKALPDLKEGRHGTQTVVLNQQLIIGAGSGNRGGGPELTSFEVFGTGDLNLKAEPVRKGELTASTEAVVFSDEGEVQEMEIRNSGGNQGMFISYLQTDTPESFEVGLPYPLPFVIAPGKNVGVKIKARQKGSSGKLFVKSLGNSAPLEIDLHIE